MKVLAFLLVIGYFVLIITKGILKIPDVVIEMPLVGGLIILGLLVVLLLGLLVRRK